MTAPGDLVELEVLRVAHGGVFVAEGADGRVVFVPDTAPGERVLARITDVRASWSRAEALTVLRSSPARREHVWASAAIDRPPADRAGGAEFGHLDPAAQRRLKTTVLVDALRRTGGFSADDLDALRVEVRAVSGEPDGTRSRTRVRLHVDAAGRAGPFAARSHRVVAVPDVPLAVAPLEALLPVAAPPGPVDLVAPGAGPARALPAGRPAPAVTETVGDRRFAVAADGFWQVHPRAPEVLTAAVRAAARGRLDPDAAHLDLYGGVGLLAAALADEGGPGIRVTTVEADRVASAHAGANLADLPGARALRARAEAFLEREPAVSGGGVVVLDPPRSGAGRRAMELIAARRPARIVYVACDPVALARDAGVLARLGWSPVAIDAIDLFPNTHHLEAVVAFDPA